MDKEEIAEIFEEMALLLELKGDNPFKIRAYRNGARAVLGVEGDLSDPKVRLDLANHPGIGESLSKKIDTLVKKGRLPAYEQLQRSVPTPLLELIRIPGIGPKKARILYQKLRIRSITGLKRAALCGKIAPLPGFGTKTEKNILNAITEKTIQQKRHIWWEANRLAEQIRDALRRVRSVECVEIAGSIRRKLETVGDIDFVVASNEGSFVTQWFTKQSFVRRILSEGETKASILTRNDIQVDLRVVTPSQFPFALCYFTGSREHVIHMRTMAQKKGWSLNEYELNKVKRSSHLPSHPLKSEEAIYNAFGLSYIPPELRENMGEFEAAASNSLPHLVEEHDIRGSFHNHTNESDGRNTLHEMVAKAEVLGWEYIGISDHSVSDYQANGLNEERLTKQIAEIRSLNRSQRYRPYIFAGIECSVLSDGSLDCNDKTLQKLDYVIISIHSSLQQDERTMTRRLIRAIEHPLSTIVGHVTGRILLERKPYAINLNKIIDACIANHKIIEINGNPQRLDMDWRNWHAASQRGLLCCINADAHSAEQLTFVNTGVNIARKGWLEAHHIINTRSLADVKKFLRNL